MRARSSRARNIDWILIICYLLFITMGWISIYSATTDSMGVPVSSKAFMQAIWIGISLFGAIIILISPTKYYFSLPYLLYTITLVLMLSTIFFGVEINGAKSWFSIGPIRFQPVELGKLTTALVLARYMNGYTFKMSNISSLVNIGIIIGLPILIIILQNDMGSALVFGSFIFMLYREGLNESIYLCLSIFIILFISTLTITPLFLTFVIIAVCTLTVAYLSKSRRASITYLFSIMLIYITAKIVLSLLNIEIEDSSILQYTYFASLPFIIIYNSKRQDKTILILSLICFLAICFTLSVDYIFDNLLQLHQQKRIYDLLGIESDVMGWGYNVNQSKIAIGSGGLFGKGFMEGTQTKYNFVPEHSTDFIFCTIGEEFGFIGSASIITLFIIFICRLIILADRQTDTFNRVYTLCVASIFLFHLIINVGMTIGIMPVIGIPLPFFSYGGSSLLAFTLLLFIAIRLNMETRD